MGLRFDLKLPWVLAALMVVVVVAGPQLFRLSDQLAAARVADALQRMHALVEKQATYSVYSAELERTREAVRRYSTSPAGLRARGCMTSAELALSWFERYAEALKAMEAGRIGREALDVVSSAVKEATRAEIEVCRRGSGLLRLFK